MNKKFDYDALERTYVQGTMSLRELADSVDMKNHSLIMRQSKKRNWADKRKKYREQANQTALTVMAENEGDTIAMRETQVRRNAVDAIDEMVQQLRENLKKTRTVIVNGVPEQQPLVIVKPMEIAHLIDRLNVLFGKPSQITESHNLDVELKSADPDLLRSVVEATRGVGLDAGPTAESPLPVAPAPSNGERPPGD